MAEQHSRIDFGSGFLQAGYIRQYFDDFAFELGTFGYTYLTIQGYAGSIAHFGYWAQRKDLAVDDWNRDTVAEFARHRCHCPGTRRSTRVSKKYSQRVKRFIIYLEQQKVIATDKRAVEPDPSEFHDWLIQHRGLCTRTVERYEHALTKLLPTGGIEVSELTAVRVRSLVLKYAQCHSSNQTRTLVLAFRAYLRFLASNGRCRPGLHRAIPTIPQWRLSALPRYLPPQDVERIIASCSIDTPLGLRDRAILLLLARLGLRAGDIVKLRLDDIDWNAATLKVCGKGRQEVCLPLPQDVGDAVLAYLREGRYPVDIQPLFLCTQAPFRPLGGSPSVSCVVSSALRRAGILNPPTRGANLLRHSAATAMLRGGATLYAVSSMLRHRSLDMTGHYAKVDVGMLEQVVQPWPEGVPC